MSYDSSLQLDRPRWERSAPDELGPDDILLVRARLSEWTDRWERWSERVLSDDEIERANRFEFEEDRRRHRLGRLIARVLLGRLTETPPPELTFETGPHDKPRLRDRTPRFNISHGGDVVLAGFTAETRLGVDVEAADRKDGAGGLARSVTTDAEYETWSRVADALRSRFFMHLWTAKESLIKATGEGLTRDPTTIELAFEGATITGIRTIEKAASDIEVGPPSEWWLHPFEIEDDTVAALTARRREPASIRYVEFSEQLRRERD